MVMDYIPGQTLAEVVFGGQPLSEAIAVHYIRQVGNALTVVNQNNLLHRDIKPQNIILRENTEVVILIDFGIAREFIAGKTQIHTNLVSDGYAPLEQYLPQGKRTAATDVYGLAATLYTLLTGIVPVPATKRGQQEIPSPRELQPQLSVTVNQAVLNGMALDIQHRPQTVDEWLKLLSDFPINSSTIRVIPNHSSQTLENGKTVHVNLSQTQRPSSILMWGILGAIATLMAGALAAIVFNSQDSSNSPIVKPTESSPSVQPSEIIAETPTPKPRPETELTPSPEPSNTQQLTLPPTPKPTSSSITPTVKYSPTIPPLQEKPKSKPPKVGYPKPTPSPEDSVEDSVSEKLIDLVLPDNIPSDPIDNTTLKDSLPVIRGLPPGKLESEVIKLLGKPTKVEEDGYWPNTKAVIYDLLPNQITLGYIYDRDSLRLRQTELSVADNIDKLMVKVALTNMLQRKSTPEIEQGLQDVRSGKIIRYKFKTGNLEGLIERNRENRVYICLLYTSPSPRDA